MLELAKYLAEKRLTWEGVARKTGISSERLQSIAAGAPYSLGEMRKLSKALRLPLSTFSQSPSGDKLRVLFRQNIATQDASADASIAALSRQIENALALARGLPSNSAWLTSFADLSPSFENAEQFAVRFRDCFLACDQLSPVLNLPQIASDEMGIFVLFSDDIEAEGASALVEQYAFIFLAPRRFQPRMLFTLAHEIGHLLARHHERDKGFATYDREGDIGTWRSSRRRAEMFADGFATALLLPRDAVARVLRKVRDLYALTGPLGDIEINYLARFFGVSFEVAGRRCEALGLLPKYGARVLYDHLVKGHTNPERRADEVGLPPRAKVEFSVSTHLLAAARRKLHEGAISIGNVAETLHLPLESLYAANVESGE